MEENAEMKEVRNKFNNFKALCLKIDQGNEWIVYFQSISLEFFIYTMRGKLNENPEHTIDSIYLDIITTAKLDDEKVGCEVKNTVKRYINYFMSIIKSTN